MRDGNEEATAPPRQVRVRLRRRGGQRGRPGRGCDSGEGEAERQGRERERVKPATWLRAAKWAAVYGLLMLVFTVSTAKKGSSPVGGVLAALLFAVVFLPGIYYLHRLQYRTYLRQLEKQKTAKAGR
jgi:hypothetical protein